MLKEYEMSGKVASFHFAHKVERFVEHFFVYGAELEALRSTERKVRLSLTDKRMYSIEINYSRNRFLQRKQWASQQIYRSVSSFFQQENDIRGISFMFLDVDAY